MKNTKKIVGILMLFSSVCCLLLGITCGKMSNQYKGTSITMGYYSGDEVVLDSNSTNVIGGNSEGVRKFKTYSQLSYVFCVIFLGFGLMQISAYRKEEKLPVQKKIGKVIEKTAGNFVIVQFKDGTRQRLMTDIAVILTEGDVGYMDIKGQKILAFKPGNK